MATQKISKNIFIEPRERLIGWVRKQLIGPPDREKKNGPDIIGVLPTERFPCGALYPISPEGEGIDLANEDVEEADEIPGFAGETKEEPAIVRRYIPPSSLGFSFFIRGEDIRFQVLCRAVRYEGTKHDERDKQGQFKKSEWTRNQLPSETQNVEDFENVSCPSKESRQSFTKLDGNARVDVEWRPFADGWIVTISLCNSNEVSGDKQRARDFVFARAEKTLFEAALRCVIDAGEIGSYPRVDRSLLDEEEQEIELQYSNRHVYAIGHGCAAEWKTKDSKVVEVYADTMPVVEVPQMTADTGTRGDQVLSLARLSRIHELHTDLQPELAAFVDDYATWVHDQENSISERSVDDHTTVKRIVKRMREAVSRMRMGIDLLSKNVQVRLAFTLANRAMLDQMRQHDRLQGRSRVNDDYRWRPFQLAFLLTTLESSANQESGVVPFERTHYILFKGEAR